MDCGPTRVSESEGGDRRRSCSGQSLEIWLMRWMDVDVTPQDRGHSKRYRVGDEFVWDVFYLRCLHNI